MIFVFYIGNNQKVLIGGVKAQMSDDSSDADNEPLNCNYNKKDIYRKIKSMQRYCVASQTAGFGFLRYKIWHSLLL